MMRNLTGLLVIALLAATVFYWVAKFWIKSSLLSGYAAWAMVILGVAIPISLFFRDRGGGRA